VSRHWLIIDTMNKKALTIILIVLLAIISGMAYLLMGSSNDTADTQVPKQDSTTSQQPKQRTDNATSGNYTAYNDGIVASTPGTKILFFHAPWCPQCRALETDIKQDGVPSGVTIIKVDYDSNQQLRQKYGVTIQTTMVKVDDNGDLVEKYVAYDDPTLDAVVKELL